MRYLRAAAFKRTYQSLGHVRQHRVDKTLLKLAEALEEGKIPAGLGLKLLWHEIWEARSGIKDRILFRRTSGDVLQLLLIGTHDDIKRFLKNL